MVGWLYGFVCGLGLFDANPPYKKKMIMVGWLYGFVCGLGLFDANPPYKKDDHGGLAIRDLVWTGAL